MENKFTERINGIKQERLGYRDLIFSQWHRNIGRGCYQYDIDVVEYREGRGVVALILLTSNLTNERHIINSKKYIWERTKLERKIVNYISQAINAPAYYIIHNNDFDTFHVHDLSKDLSEYIKMDL